MADYCIQCGGLCKGYYQFKTCSACYSKNVQAAQESKPKKQASKPAKD